MPLQTLLPLPAYHQESCAAGSGGAEGCRQCVDACPHGALRTRSGPAGTTVEVDAGPCQRCGACTAVCPTASLERAFLPADELRELVLEAVGAGRPIAFIGDHHYEMIEVATSAGWSVVGLPSVLIVDPVVLVTARRAGASAVAVLGCRDCHHGSLQLIEAAVEVAVALTGRAGSNLVADVDAPGTAAATEIHPRNHVEMNPADAERLGLRRGDRVRVSSASDSTEGVLTLSERVRPGVIAGTHHFGHTQQGTSDWQIKDAATAVNGGTYMDAVLHGTSTSPARGDRVHGNTRRASEGFNVNDAMRRNDDLQDTPLVDNAGGSTVFLDSRVKVEKA